MEASAASAELVRSELKSFRNRSVTITANEQCNTCGSLLLSKPFFIFACGHKFHSDCLEQQVKAYLGKILSLAFYPKIYKCVSIKYSEPNQAQRLASLKQSLAAAAIASLSETISDTNPLDQLQTEYELLLAAECFLCGHHMIESIDRPFIENWDKVVRDWL